MSYCCNIQNVIYHFKGNRENVFYYFKLKAFIKNIILSLCKCYLLDSCCYWKRMVALFYIYFDPTERPVWTIMLSWISLFEDVIVILVFTEIININMTGIYSYSIILLFLKCHKNKHFHYSMMFHLKIKQYYALLKFFIKEFSNTFFLHNQGLL